MKNLILQKLFFLFGSFARYQFVRCTRRTKEVQRKFLDGYIKDHKDTSFGRDMGLKRITSADDFRQLVPVMTFDDFRPYFERAFNGESNVITHEPVIFFSVTGGTTGGRKLVPSTRQSHRIRNRARRASTGFCAAALKKRGIRFGPIFFSNTSTMMGYTQTGIPYGKTSAGDLHLNRSSYRGSKLFPFPYQALEITHTQSRHYVCLLFAVTEPNMRVLSGNFPIFILHAVNLLERYQGDFIRDMNSGKLADWLDIADEQRESLNAQWQCHPKRAAELQEMVETHGALTPKVVWPDIGLIVTARGTPSNFYISQFKKRLGGVPVFGGIYSATEATFGVYNDFDSDEAVLLVHTGFFEFVEEADWDKPFPGTLLADEVEIGGVYRILVTNYAGFCRYDIGDVVRVLGFYEGAPTITFLRRKGGQLSSIAEKTTENHIAQVMDQLLKDFDLALYDYCVMLSDEAPARYVLNIEPMDLQDLPDLSALIAGFDEILQSLHLNYRNNRRDMVPPPMLRVLAPGSFSAVLAKSIDGPGADTNIKLLHITDDRSYLQGVNVVESVLMEERVSV